MVVVAFLQRHEAADGLARDLVRLADHGGFGHGGMMHQRRFHFHGAEAMAADVHDVVHAAQDPVIAVVVATRGVAGEIRRRGFIPVCLD